MSRHTGSKNASCTEKGEEKRGWQGRGALSSMGRLVFLVSRPGREEADGEWSDAGAECDDMTDAAVVHSLPRQLPAHLPGTQKQPAASSLQSPLPFVLFPLFPLPSSPITIHSANWPSLAVVVPTPPPLSLCLTEAGIGGEDVSGALRPCGRQTHRALIARSVHFQRFNSLSAPGYLLPRRERIARIRRCYAPVALAPKYVVCHIPLVLLLITCRAIVWA